MTGDDFVGRLDRARRTGNGSWIACCPAHGDKSPSLTVREVDDGRLLIHCFGGCGAAEVVASMGLALGDLFPPKPAGDFAKPVRRPFPAADVLEAMAHELLTAQQIVVSVAESGSATAAQRARLAQAASRIENARKVANG